ncbi:FAD-dependent oxidoreductase [Methanomassiliicoccus luminyensis]|uniref:FAD-dependent oxidoreductase n=1 Tax=Methanomassiliicoccus luminyensis TaxID=1080712 RepID=UPI0003786BE2|nr:FAD-dependent oxidoreductase [Methanomassiliicoccus luminyensis]
MIIGGGIAGISAALALADLGHAVEIVEKEASLGGQAGHLAITFPGGAPGSGVVSSLVEKLSGNGGIKVDRGARLSSLSRLDGRFEAELDIGGTVSADAVVLATGLEPISPSAYPELGYGVHKGVVTSWELESMMDDGPVSKADGSPAKRVVFVQCVGSRAERKGVPYCTGACCPNAIKEALALKERDPAAEAYVLYIDIRTSGKGQEAMYRRARKAGVRFIRGQPSMVVEKDGGLVVCGENTLLRELYEIPADLVVLAVGSRQSPENLLLLDMLGVRQGASGFPEHFQTSDGVFLAGSAEGPMDIPTTVASARSGALAVHSYLTARSA